LCALPRDVFKLCGIDDAALLILTVVCLTSDKDVNGNNLATDRLELDKRLFLLGLVEG
jgi:hypothetical protein